MRRWISGRRSRGRAGLTDGPQEPGPGRRRIARASWPHSTARGVRAGAHRDSGATPRIEHLAAFGQIDIQLDPFPHGGGATTFEGLLQGVPCVTLLGELIQGRLSASFLTTLGLMT